MIFLTIGSIFEEIGVGLFGSYELFAILLLALIVLMTFLLNNPLPLVFGFVIIAARIFQVEWGGQMMSSIVGISVLVFGFALAYFFWYIFKRGD